MTSTLLQNGLIVCAILGFAAMEYFSRRYKQTVTASGNDTKLETAMFISLLAVSQPLAFLGATKLCEWLAPGARGVWSGLPGWAWLAIILVADDMTQYWWHRLSHKPLLWSLHRAHHSARYMSIRITYRNNFFYYLMMPGLWMAGALTYLGVSPWGYAAYFVVKITVILGAHCAWRWDEALYRIPALHPVMWVLERTISTPATHHAHHALTNSDGIGHYKGNYGNLLFIWDMIFGTAHITRRYPAQVGLMDDALFGDEHWTTQMFFPLLHSRRAHTALKFGGEMYEDPPPDHPAAFPSAAKA